MNAGGINGSKLNIEEVNNHSEDLKLKKACQDFESLFINFIFKSMRKTVPESDLIKKGSGEKMYRDMLDVEVSSELSKGKGFGLSDSLYRQLRVEVDKKN